MTVKPSAKLVLTVTPETGSREEKYSIPQFNIQDKECHVNLYAFFAHTSPTLPFKHDTVKDYILNSLDAISDAYTNGAEDYVDVIVDFCHAVADVEDWISENTEEFSQTGLYTHTEYYTFAQRVISLLYYENLKSSINVYGLLDSIKDEVDLII